MMNNQDIPCFTDRAEELSKQYELNFQNLLAKDGVLFEKQKFCVLSVVAVAVGWWIWAGISIL